MRLLRISLTNFRGVAFHQLEFAPQGVTVVEGPNESGKSSTVEAFGLLLDEYDSSKKQSVLSTKPRHGDEAPEVEAEFTTGAYHLVYSKRWLKQAGTSLRILAPEPETLSGREAHDRVLAILDKTMDVGLFKALRVIQDKPFDVTDLDGSSSLRRALDLAAGGESPAGGAEDTLLQRVEDELKTFYTPKNHQPTGIYKAAQLEAIEADELAGRLKADLERVEQDAQQHEEVAARLAEHKRCLLEDQAELAGLRTRSAGITRLLTRRNDAADVKRDAEHAEQVVSIALAARRALVVSVDAFDTELTASRQAIALLDVQRKAADAHRGTALTDQKLADDAHRTAHRDLRSAEADLGWLRDRRDLDRVLADSEAIAAGEEEVKNASAACLATEIDDNLFARIEDADHAVRAARTALETAAATVRVENLGAVPVNLGGGALHVGGAEVHRITEPLVIEAPGVLRVTLGPGASERERTATFEAAQATLAELCAEAGVRDLATARVRYNRSIEMRAVLSAAESAHAQLGGEAQAAALATERGRLEKRITSYEEDRDPGLLPPADLDEAEAVVEGRRRRADEASSELDIANAALETADSSVNQLAQDAQKLIGGAEQLEANHAAASSRLDTARAEESDADLEERYRRLAEELEKAKSAHVVHDAAYREAEPDQVELLLKNAESIVGRTEAELKQANDELHILNGRLSADGNDGLAERHAEASSHLDTARRNLDALTARAEAADLLYSVLSARREEATKAYQGPFKEKVEWFGGMLFGQGFSVVVGDDLRVSHRNLAGRRDPYSELSTGAREALAMCVRLACASLVSADEGVPVVIDDALGAADPDRRRRLGALLGHAGQDAQIIVFTCDPERYRAVGSAQVLRLGDNDVRETALD